MLKYPWRKHAKMTTEKCYIKKRYGRVWTFIMIPCVHILGQVYTFLMRIHAFVELLLLMLYRIYTVCASLYNKIKYKRFMRALLKGAYNQIGGTSGTKGNN